MKIVKPSVKLIPQQDINDHIQYCAKVCYASDSTEDSKTYVERLIKNNHISMLRHATVHFIISKDNPLYSLFTNNPFSSVFSDRNNVFITTNMQVIHDNGLNNFLNNAVPIEEFQNISPKSNYDRFTFEVHTQISTSRELNRVSPNSIAEQSTRYCNFSKDKFDGLVTLCQPHWFDVLGEHKEAVFSLQYWNPTLKFDDSNISIDLNKIPIVINKYSDKVVDIYLRNFYNNANTYNDLVNFHAVAPQDARGELHLDTLTKCIYTYTVEEWRHIIDLRYYGTTGAPHPNAKIIASMIRNELIKLGYDFR